MRNHTGNNGMHKPNNPSNGGCIYLIAAAIVVVVILAIVAYSAGRGR
jgi:hypothetical protein